MKLEKKQRKQSMKMQNNTHKLFGVFAFQKHKLHCKRCIEWNDENVIATRRYIDEFNKIIFLCMKHHLEEIRIKYEEWAEEYGSFCMECGEDITVELLNNSELLCYCTDHRKDIK